MDTRLITDITLAEGCKLTAYRDSLGFWTIGVGHKLDQSQDWAGYTITQEQSDAFLDNDLKSAQESCVYLSEWPSLDTSCRQNAVIELCFNMGVAGWRGFIRTRYDILHKYWQAAHDDLLNSKWAVQVGEFRSNRLANYLLTGQYPNA